MLLQLHVTTLRGLTHLAGVELNLAEYVQPFLQMLEQHQECLKRQREAVKNRLKKLATRQSEITVSLYFATRLIHFVLLVQNNKTRYIPSINITSVSRQ